MLPTSSLQIGYDPIGQQNLLLPELIRRAELLLRLHFIPQLSSLAEMSLDLFCALVDSAEGTRDKTIVPPQTAAKPVGLPKARKRARQLLPLAVADVETVWLN
jgi:hypothetical protein